MNGKPSPQPGSGPGPGAESAPAPVRFFPGVKPKKPRGPTRRSLAGIDEIVELRARADVVNKLSRALVDFKIRLKPEVYRRIVELAEENACPLQVVAVNALVDGLLRYGEFSQSYGPQALVKVVPSRAFARDLTAPITLVNPKVRAPVDEEFADPQYARKLKIERVVEDLQVPLPGSPPLRRELAE